MSLVVVMAKKVDEKERMNLRTLDLVFRSEISLDLFLENEPGREEKRLERSCMKGVIREENSLINDLKEK